MKKLLKYFQSNKNKPANLNRWRYWAARILKRRNHTVDLTICAYDKQHLVERVRPFGEGFVFWSSACGGCMLGASIIQLYQNTKKVPQQTHCAFLKSGLLTKDLVKPGDVYHLPARELE